MESIVRHRPARQRHESQQLLNVAGANDRAVRGCGHR